MMHCSQYNTITRDFFCENMDEALYTKRVSELSFMDKVIIENYVKDQTMHLRERLPADIGQNQVLALYDGGFCLKYQQGEEVHYIFYDKEIVKKKGE